MSLISVLRSWPSLIWWRRGSLATSISKRITQSFSRRRVYSQSGGVFKYGSSASVRGRTHSLSWINKAIRG